MSKLAAETFSLPDLGEGLTEAEVVAWYVQVGDHVVPDQPLLAVETDKAMVDIPAPHAGRLGQIIAGVGTVVKVGEPLFTFGDSAAPGPGSISVVGDLASAKKPALSPEPPAETVIAATPIPKASPRARQRARELSVVLTEVTPSGPGGVVQVADVEAAAVDTAVIDRAEADSTMSPTRRSMAKRMAAADAQVVRATVTGEADISAWGPDSATLLRLIRAVGQACLAQPLFNASFDGETLRLCPQPTVDLGIAMESEVGLLVPVLRDINAQSAMQLTAALTALKTAVEARSIDAADLRGQSITLSNFGAVGGLHAEMVVVPPQVAIVGAGRSFERVGMVAGEPTARRVLPLSITFDHRAVTGAEACHFLLALTADLELTE